MNQRRGAASSIPWAMVQSQGLGTQRPCCLCGAQLHFVPNEGSYFRTNIASVTRGGGPYIRDPQSEEFHSDESQRTATEIAVNVM